MNSVVGRAVNICTLFYILVGFFGYISIGGTSGNIDSRFSCRKTTGDLIGIILIFVIFMQGNILLNLTTSWSTDMIKCGFVMSIVFSFPLCVFPCRASLYSLLFRGVIWFNLTLIFIHIFNILFLILIRVLYFVESPCPSSPRDPHAGPDDTITDSGNCFGDTGYWSPHSKYRVGSGSRWLHGWCSRVHNFPKFTLHQSHWRKSHNGKAYGQSKHTIKWIRFCPIHCSW